MYTKSFYSLLYYVGTVQKKTPRSIILSSYLSECPVGVGIKKMCIAFNKATFIKNSDESRFIFIIICVGILIE